MSCTAKKRLNCEQPRPNSSHLRRCGQRRKRPAFGPGSAHVEQWRGEARSELSHTRLAIRHAQDELKVRQARLAASKQTPQPADELQSYIDELVDEFGIDVARAQREAELQRYIDADQALSKISDEIEEVDNHIADLRKGTKDPLLSKLVGDQQAKKKQLQKQFTVRLAKLKKANHSGLDPETAELQACTSVPRKRRNGRQATSRNSGKRPRSSAIHRSKSR